jgi:hypothetical protein
MPKGVARFETLRRGLLPSFQSQTLKETLWLAEETQMMSASSPATSGHNYQRTQLTPPPSHRPSSDPSTQVFDEMLTTGVVITGRHAVYAPSC